RNVRRCRRYGKRRANRRNDEACWRCDGLIAKTIIVVFELQRPSRCHCMLDAGTDGPAPPAVMEGCRSGLRKSAEEFIVWVDRTFVSNPGKTTLGIDECVSQRSSPHAQSTGEAGKVFDLRLAVRADEKPGELQAGVAAVGAHQAAIGFKTEN